MAELNGRLIKGVFSSDIFYKGAVFNYTVHIPEECEGMKDCGLIVTHDDLNTADAIAAGELARAGEAPFCISVGIGYSELLPTLEGGTPRALRMNTYDMTSRRFPDFIVDEFIPFIIKEYSLSVSADPDMHLISGGSSGGVSAWNIAYRRNDFFRRAYISSPSFLAMGGGDCALTLVRKLEPRPIRLFTDYSENEPDDYFGSSYTVAMAFDMALRYAGYDYRCEYYPGEGHCSRNTDVDSSVSRQRFLWKDYSKAPVTTGRPSDRLSAILPGDSEWGDVCCEVPPHKRCRVTRISGDYIADGERILFTSDSGRTEVVATGFSQVSALALSSDKWRLYIADRGRAAVYAMAIREDGTLDDAYLHAALHTEPGQVCVGAVDIDVDECDRVYALTEMGIQCIRSFGLIDLILPLPAGKAFERICLTGDRQLIISGDTTLARATVRAAADKEVSTVPAHRGYYD